MTSAEEAAALEDWLARSLERAYEQGQRFWAQVDEVVEACSTGEVKDTATLTPPAQSVAE